jgi:hypothetical protein
MQDQQWPEIKSSKIKFSRQYKVPWWLHTGWLFWVFGSVCVVVCSDVKSTTSESWKNNPPHLTRCP